MSGSNKSFHFSNLQLLWVINIGSIILMGDYNIMCNADLPDILIGVCRGLRACALQTKNIKPPFIEFCYYDNFWGAGVCRRGLTYSSPRQHTRWSMSARADILSGGCREAQGLRLQTKNIKPLFMIHNFAIMIIFGG